MGRAINLFMFGYQESYRLHIQLLARSVLKKLGVKEDAYALLVGARRPDSRDRNPVCVEPEDGRWSVLLFDGLLQRVEERYKSHRLQNMYFGDEPSMRDKPEWMRRDSVANAIHEKLLAYDAANLVTSFCGDARLVDEHYVTPVLQLPNSIFDRFPPLPDRPVKDERWGNGYRSLIHAAMDGVLGAATEELERPEPGRFTDGAMRRAGEIIAIAADRFMLTPGRAINQHFINNDLYQKICLASSLLYEGDRGVGDLIFVDPENEAIEYLLKFTDSVPLGETRWVRKVLQMATTGAGIISNGEAIIGLGSLKADHDPMAAQDAFTVSFLDHYLWELRCGSHALLRSRYGVATLPNEPFDKPAFIANYLRRFPAATREEALHLWALVLAQVRQDHGSMLVIAEDAASEAKRLSGQGTRIDPVPLTRSLLHSVSGIDGTILLDPHGVCHAIGMILDGEASEHCVAARGSRYNSGVRYVYGQRRRLAIVVSDDRIFDVVPPLVDLVSKALIARHLATLEAATNENYHDSRNWLRDHCFYLDAEQCARANASIERIDAEPREWNRLHLNTPRFEPHPEMDGSYLTD